MRCSRLSSCGFLLALAQPASRADSPPPLRAVRFNVLHGGFGFRGDGQHLNSTADTSGVKRLLADEGLVDTFRTANPHAPGFTVWQPARAESSSCSTAVDYVLVASGADAPARVRASLVILDRPGRGADGKALLGPLPQRPPPCVSPPRGPRRPGPPGDRSLPETCQNPNASFAPSNDPAFGIPAF